MPTPAEARRDWKAAWPWAFWALWGLWLAVSDPSQDGLQSALMRLMIGATVLAAARPRWWWLWSMAMAAWVMVVPLYGLVFRLTPAGHPILGDWLLAPLPALVGGYLGCMFAAAVREASPRRKAAEREDDPGSAGRPIFYRDLR